MSVIHIGGITPNNSVVFLNIISVSSIYFVVSSSSYPVITLLDIPLISVIVARNVVTCIGNVFNRELVPFLFTLFFIIVTFIIVPSSLKRSEIVPKLLQRVLIWSLFKQCLLPMIFIMVERADITSGMTCRAPRLMTLGVCRIFVSAFYLLLSSTFLLVSNDASFMIINYIFTFGLNGTK